MQQKQHLERLAVCRQVSCDLQAKRQKMQKFIQLRSQKHILKYQILISTFFSRFLPFRLLMLFIPLNSQSR